MFDIYSASAHTRLASSTSQSDTVASVFIRKVKKNNYIQIKYCFCLYIRLHVLLVKLGYRHHYIDYILHGKRKNISALFVSEMLFGNEKRGANVKKTILHFSKDRENTPAW